MTATEHDDVIKRLGGMDREALISEASLLTGSGRAYRVQIETMAKVASVRERQFARSRGALDAIIHIIETGSADRLQAIKDIIETHTERDNDGNQSG